MCFFAKLTRRFELLGDFDHDAADNGARLQLLENGRDILEPRYLHGRLDLPRHSMAEEIAHLLLGAGGDPGDGEA